MEQGIEMMIYWPDVLIVTHQAPLRTLLAYFTGESLQNLVSYNIPLHTLYCIQPMPYACQVTTCKSILLFKIVVLKKGGNDDYELVKNDE